MSSRPEDLLARYVFLEQVTFRKRVIEVGAWAETEGRSAEFLVERGASFVTVCDPAMPADMQGDARISLHACRFTELEKVPLCDVIVAHDSEVLNEEGFLERARHGVGPRGRFVLIMPNPGDAYDDVIAAIQPYFASIELGMETHLASHSIVPLGIEDPDVVIDGTMAPAVAASHYIFICGQEPLGLFAQAVTLLGTDESEREALSAQAAETDAQLDAANAALLSLRAEAAAEKEELVGQIEALRERLASAELAAAALETAEGRLVEMTRLVRELEEERELGNQQRQTIDALSAREEELRKALEEVEAARRLAEDERARSDRYASELDVRLALRKSDLAHRDERIRKLVDEVQRLEQELESERIEGAAREQALEAERDERRASASRLSRECEAALSETQRLSALLERARDDIAVLNEQLAVERGLAQSRGQALEQALERAASLNDALIKTNQESEERARQLAQAQAAILQADESARHSQQEMEEVSARLQESTQSTAALRSAKESVDAALKAASLERDALREEMAQERAKLEELHKRVDAAHAEHKRLAEEAAQHARELKKREDARVEAETELELVRAALEEAETRVQKADRTTHEARAEAAAGLKAVEEKLAAAQTAAQEAERASANLREQLAALEKKSKEAELALQHKAAEVERYSKAAAEAAAQIVSLKRRGTELEEQVLGMTSSSANAQAELEDKVHKLEAKVAERDRLVSSQHGKLRDADKAKQAAEEKTKVLEAKVAELTGKVGELTAKIAEMEKPAPVANAPLGKPPLGKPPLGKPSEDWQLLESFQEDKLAEVTETEPTRVLK